MVLVVRKTGSGQNAQVLDRMPRFKTQLSMYKMRIIIRTSTKRLF